MVYAQLLDLVENVRERPADPGTQAALRKARDEFREMAVAGSVKPTPRTSPRRTPSAGGLMERLGPARLRPVAGSRSPGAAPG